MIHGQFISLEGGEGVGKSTQAHLLAEALRERGFEVVLTREPGGTAAAEAIRQLLLDPPDDGWNLKAEALLFAAARSDHVQKLIRPALQAGKWVICDRFIDSTRAYQGGGGGLPDADIMALHEFGSEGLLPDRTFLIEAPAELLRGRIAERDGDSSDAIGGRADDYHARVAAEFSRICGDSPERFVRVDGKGTAQDIHSRILAALEPLLEKGV